MKIALDFDGTFTEEPDLWVDFIRAFQSKGHKIYIVTFRSPHQRHEAMDYLNVLGVRTIFTDRTPKKKYCDKHGIKIDIWIDDQPELIVNESDWTIEDVKAWESTQEFI